MCIAGALSGLSDPVKYLLLGGFLAAVPGAAIANIGVAYLRKRLGVTPHQVKSADDAGTGTPSGDGGGGGDGSGG